MALEQQEVRRIEKQLTGSGVKPTIAPSSDHTDGTWSATDIYPGELCFNKTDNILYTSNGAHIIKWQGTVVE